jgi:uncharacterized protein YggE
MKISPFFQAIIGALALMVIIFVGVLTWNAAAQHRLIGKPADVRDTLSVSGVAKLSVKPDIARITIGVISTGSNVAATQKQNTDKMNAITSAIKGFGVKDDDIQTSNYNIYPQYDYADGRQTLRGYQVSQQLSVKVRDLEKIGDILAKSGELGSNQVGGVSFEVDDTTAIQKQARDKAIADAKEKAQVLAKSLGVQLGKVVSFSEDYGSSPVPMLYNSYNKVMDEAAGAPAPDIQSGSMDVSKSVSITFEIK